MAPPPPVPIQGMNDMASQQRALQSYMDSMFASVPPPSSSAQGMQQSQQGQQQGQQQQQQPLQGNMMQQSFNATPQGMNANLPPNGQQQQQQMFHPGVPTIFQPGGANSNNVSNCFKSSVDYVGEDADFWFC